MHDSVIYEAHVKGLTMLHPEVPAPIRGTYAAVGHPAIVAYLKELGVTAVELLPVHQSTDDRYLVDKGLQNYWGYTTNFTERLRKEALHSSTALQLYSSTSPRVEVWSCRDDASSCGVYLHLV